MSNKRRTIEQIIESYSGRSLEDDELGSVAVDKIMKLVGKRPKVSYEMATLFREQCIGLYPVEGGDVTPYNPYIQSICVAGGCKDNYRPGHRERFLKFLKEVIERLEEEQQDA